MKSTLLKPHNALLSVLLCLCCFHSIGRGQVFFGTGELTGDGVIGFGIDISAGGESSRTAYTRATIFDITDYLGGGGTVYLTSDDIVASCAVEVSNQESFYFEGSENCTLVNGGMYGSWGSANITVELSPGRWYAVLIDTPPDSGDSIWNLNSWNPSSGQPPPMNFNGYNSRTSPYSFGVSWSVVDGEGHAFFSSYFFGFYWYIDKW
jgi:hypothetical protein